MTRKLNIDQARQLPVTYAATIPEEYLDAMGHMNVMWYTHLFSLAMGGLFHQLGMSWEQMEKHHGGTFALETHIRYLSEVQVGQAIEVHSRLLDRSVKRFHVLHFMTNLDKQDVAGTLESVTAHIDLHTRRMAAIPSDIAQRLDQLIEEHGKLEWKAPVCGVMRA